ncbi:hypothetical protein Golax_006394 [Gossypium laxum]|uniref:EF-hand domain-containing protein n=1 Tax=Gossypium laxum TaxID=34288 RepID=A0A7J9A3M9_9ROSI|nr:hypothetical protein [Gossypium laxum]
MGKDLSDEQVSSMKEAFTLFDTDGDGKIAPSELGILMRSLGGNPTQAQLKAIIAEEKLTAPFDFPRFLDLMSKHMKPEPFDRQLRDAFKVLDKDNTGFVSVADLRHILTSIGEKLEPSEFDEWIREVDVGPDGKIRYEDFIARMVAKIACKIPSERPNYPMTEDAKNRLWMREFLILLRAVSLIAKDEIKMKLGYRFVAAASGCKLALIMVEYYLELSLIRERGVDVCT